MLAQIIARLDTINQTQDNHGAQLSTINNRLESHNTRLARGRDDQDRRRRQPEGGRRRGSCDNRAAMPSNPDATCATKHVGVPRFHKLDFLTFDGKDDPLPWVSRCERFFRGQRTMEEKVWLASYHLTGSAQTWFCRLEREEGTPSWHRFTDLVNIRFSPPLRHNPLGELVQLSNKPRCPLRYCSFQISAKHSLWNAMLLDQVLSLFFIKAADQSPFSATPLHLDTLNWQHTSEC